MDQPLNKSRWERIYETARILLPHMNTDSRKRDISFAIQWAIDLEDQIVINMRSEQQTLKAQHGKKEMV